MANIFLTDNDMRLLIADEELMWLIYETAKRDKMCGNGNGDWERVAKLASYRLGRPLAADVIKGATKAIKQAHHNQRRFRNING